MEFRKAREDEVRRLTEISSAAFESDTEVGGEAGGPPGYDSFEEHAKHRMYGNLYAFLADGSIVGGAIVHCMKDHIYVGRIFVDPGHYRKGYGRMLMEAIERTFFAYSVFRLDTPAWNVRTNAFYKKCGYRVAGITPAPGVDLIEYEKIIGQDCIREKINTDSVIGRN